MPTQTSLKQQSYLLPAPLLAPVVLRVDRRRRSRLNDSRSDFFSDLPRDRVPPSLVAFPGPVQGENSGR